MSLVEPCEGLCHWLNREYSLIQSLVEGWVLQVWIVESMPLSHV